MLNDDELPQMDGTCDACEPDEAQTASLVCHKCSFAFCSLHAERHATSTRHPLAPYHHDNAHANGRGSIRDNSSGGEAEMGGNRKSDVNADAGLRPETAVGEGALGAEAGQGATVPTDQKRDAVTVERLRCLEHEQEGTLYCKPDEKIICVVCAVQGEHRAHEIITLQDAYLWQKASNADSGGFVTPTCVSVSRFCFGAVSPIHPRSISHEAIQLHRRLIHLCGRCGS